MAVSAAVAYVLYSVSLRFGLSRAGWYMIRHSGPVLDGSGIRLPMKNFGKAVLSRIGISGIVVIIPASRVRLPVRVIGNAEFRKISAPLLLNRRLSPAFLQQEMKTQ